MLFIFLHNVFSPLFVNYILPTFIDFEGACNKLSCSHFAELFDSKA